MEISGRCRDQLRAISCLLRDRPSPPLAPASSRRSRHRISSVEAVSAVRVESQPWHARSRAAPRSDSQRTGTLRKATSQRQARRIRISALKRENGTFGRKSMSLAWLHSQHKILRALDTPGQGEGISAPGGFGCEKISIRAQKVTIKKSPIGNTRARCPYTPATHPPVRELPQSRQVPRGSGSGYSSGHGRS